MVALIITVIILLILTGIVISLTLGDNGILQRAQQGTKTYLEQSAREKMELKLANLHSDKIAKEFRSATLQDLDEFVTQGADLYDSEIKYVEIFGTTANIIMDGYLFKVDSNLNIISVTKWDGKITYHYDYTGEVQEFIAKKDGMYEIECWGAGNLQEDSSARGAYTYGKIKLNKGQKFYLYVGESGTNGSKILVSNGRYTAFNGGGATCFYSGYLRTSGGSGATDIRISNGECTDFESLKSRIMVAGGSAGEFSLGGNFTSGAGGKLIGLNGTSNASSGYILGKGGTQTSGGTGHVAGKFGIGGSGSPTSSTDDAASGGGGYYGGGSGYHSEVKAGGGGGSSFISGFTGCNAIQESSTQNNIIHTGSPDHYSGFTFINSKMIAGNEEMPNYRDGNMVGNHGNGHARITLLLEE